MSYSPDELTVHSVSFAGTILEAVDLEFIYARIVPSDGSVAVAVLVDALPPFDFGVLPNIGLPLTLAYVHATILVEARDDVSLFFRDDLFLPPVSNIYVVDEVRLA